MRKVAIIGAGISGLSLAQMLKDHFEVTVFERSSKPGGLVKCDRVNDNLFHRVGGHVFNSKNPEVLNWFWNFFDQEKEFIKARRNAKIRLLGKTIGYPLENYLFELPKSIVDKVLTEFLAPGYQPKDPFSYPNFAAFLEENFGKTLYELYFKPYNTKIWNCDLSKVPLSWLEGKLPMPNLKEMLLSNIVKQEEEGMVHATFYYAKEEGSQFIVNRLSENLTIKTNSPIQKIEKKSNGLLEINGQESFDKVVFTGDVRHLGEIYISNEASFKDLAKSVSDLKSNGTSNLLCECDPTEVSWMYLPEKEIQAHRIIYTGNFSPHNNKGSDRLTCTVEFSGKHSVEFMSEQVKMLPGNMKVLDFNYEPNSYVIQDADTRDRISDLKQITESENLYLLGRFGEWEYYNMDKAIEASFSIRDKFLKS